MKKSQNICPGCSKHCPVSAPRCKCGRKYFDKQENIAKEKPYPDPKWKKRLEPDGLIRRLFAVRRRMKKALRTGRVTEEELLCVLSDEQHAQLAEILSALEKCLAWCEKSKR